MMEDTYWEIFNVALSFIAITKQTFFNKHSGESCNQHQVPAKFQHWQVNSPTQLASLPGSEMNFRCRLTNTDTNHPQNVISPKHFKQIKHTQHFHRMVLALVRNYFKTGLFKMLFSTVRCVSLCSLALCDQIN